MQNIEAILKQFNLEVPKEQSEEFRKVFHENYKTVKDYEKVESDRDKWKGQAETAEETLKKFDSVDLETMQTELATWKTKAETAEKDYQQKIYDRDFSDALRTEMESIKFSSEAAKKAVMTEIKESGLKLKDGKILGLSDLIGQIKERDASAFVDEQQQRAQQQAARFTTPGTGRTPGGHGTMTKKDIYAIKDPSERQAAIAENLGLFGQGEE